MSEHSSQMEAMFINLQTFLETRAVLTTSPLVPPICHSRVRLTENLTNFKLRPTTPNMSQRGGQTLRHAAAASNIMLR